MRPSSCELTCPVNATPVALAAAATPAATKTTMTAKAANSIARKVFFSMAPS
jgi:hypothetical protein